MDDELRELIERDLRLAEDEIMALESDDPEIHFIQRKIRVRQKARFHLSKPYPDEVGLSGADWGFERGWHGAIAV